MYHKCFLYFCILIYFLAVIQLKLAKFLQATRKSKNITLMQLSEETDLSYGKIYRILNNIKKSGPIQLKKLLNL